LGYLCCDCCDFEGKGYGSWSNSQPADTFLGMSPYCRAASVAIFMLTCLTTAHAAGPATQPSRAAALAPASVVLMLDTSVYATPDYAAQRAMLQSHALLMTHERFLERLLDKNEQLRKTNFFRQTESRNERVTAANFRDALRVRVVPDTLLIEIAFLNPAAEGRDDSRDDRHIAQLVADTYVTRLQQEHFDKVNADLERAKQFRERYVRLLTMTQDRLKSLAAAEGKEVEAERKLLQEEAAEYRKLERLQNERIATLQNNLRTQTSPLIIPSTLGW